MFGSIVVGFDGSAHSSRALEIAAALSARDDIPLGIVYVADPGHMSVPADLREMGRIEHVIDPKPAMPIDIAKAPPTLLSAMSQVADDAEKALFQYAEFLVGEAAAVAREHGASRVETKVAIGNPAAQIVDYARARKADLIVIGCRGFGRLKGMLLGSTSQQVAQLADCSCLTVK